MEIYLNQRQGYGLPCSIWDLDYELAVTVQQIAVEVEGLEADDVAAAKNKPA